MTRSRHYSFTTGCKKCARLAAFLKTVKEEFPDYFAKPVPSFGDPEARLLVVGLAPGMHGANRTGRPFTGDHAGILLYKTLFDTGFSNHPESLAVDDALTLINCRITNAVRCLPPQNKPIGAEVNHCNNYLYEELVSVPKGGVVIALGAIAHNAIVSALKLKKSNYKFGHGLTHRLTDELTLIDSYHCSRYNTQTKRLTPDMFLDVFEEAKILLES